LPRFGSGSLPAVSQAKAKYPAVAHGLQQALRISGKWRCLEPGRFRAGPAAEEGAKLDYRDIKELRMKLQASKAEVARVAGVARPTFQRVEDGRSCQEETKKKVILALGFLARKKFLGEA
jgi:DNA-binding XRE family transcriptional regulator